MAKASLERAAETVRLSQQVAEQLKVAGQQPITRIVAFAQRNKARIAGVDNGLKCALSAEVPMVKQEEAASGPDVLIRKLSSLGRLSEGERQAVLGLPMHVRLFEADRHIVREGERPSQCCLILQGFTCRSKLTVDGGRQIMSFHMPGDLPDLQSLHLQVMDHDLSTITPCTLGFIPHSELRNFCERWPRLAALFWRDTLIDAAIFREWMLGMGRREAYVQIAHIICEMITKLKVVGLGDEKTTLLPITQTELADALGLTDVHVNRTLRELKGDGLFSWKRGTIVVHDWERLKDVGQFDPTYLHLGQADAEAPGSPCRTSS